MRSPSSVVPWVSALKKTPLSCPVTSLRSSTRVVLQARSRWRSGVAGSRIVLARRTAAQGRQQVTRIAAPAEPSCVPSITLRATVGGSRAPGTEIPIAVPWIVLSATRHPGHREQRHALASAARTGRRVHDRVAEDLGAIAGSDLHPDRRCRIGVVEKVVGHIGRTVEPDACRVAAKPEARDQARSAGGHRYRGAGSAVDRRGAGAISGDEVLEGERAPAADGDALGVAAVVDEDLVPRARVREGVGDRVAGVRLRTGGVRGNPRVDPRLRVDVAVDRGRGGGRNAQRQRRSNPCSKSPSEHRLPSLSASVPPHTVLLRQESNSRRSAAARSGG